MMNYDDDDDDDDDDKNEDDDEDNESFLWNGLDLKFSDMFEAWITVRDSQRFFFLMKCAFL